MNSRTRAAIIAVTFFASTAVAAPALAAGRDDGGASGHQDVGMAQMHDQMMSGDNRGLERVHEKMVSGENPAMQRMHRAV